jgi:two-component system phosphate regulon sensor histidine kinase PhoR
MDRMKSEFLANAGHELKTPLTCIISYAEFLRDYQTPETKRKEFAASILSQGEKLHQLIEELLDLASLSSTSHDLQLSEIDPAALLEREAERFHYEAEQKGLEVSVSVSPSVGIVRIDEEKTGKIVRSLIGNAVKFTPEDGSVGMLCETGGGELLIRVRDTGIGIAPEHLDLIFERFRQVDGSMTRKYGGLGVGLSLAKELAELQGGRITVKSELRKGSEFTLHLPLRATEGAGDARHEAAGDAAAPTGNPAPVASLPEPRP